VTGSSILSTTNDPAPVETRLQIVLAVLAGETTIAEAARRHGVSTESINRWRNRFFVDAGKAAMEDGMPGGKDDRTIAWTAHDDEFSSRDRSLAVAEQPAEGRRARCQALRCDEPEAMLIYSMSVSVDGFIADREGGFGWTVPDEELFRFHLARVRELGCHLCGRKLYETMLVWETDPSLRDTELHAAFADVWCALPKVVFSRTLDSVQGNARLAEASVAGEVAAALAATDKDVEIGGAGLAGAAIKLGLVDELRMFRHPIVVGGGTPFLPPVTEDVRLELIETRTFGSRVIYERYERARDESD
jgi:dihydrofolate reductase/transposase-like protein